MRQSQTREEGLKEIDEAKWVPYDGTGHLDMYVHTMDGWDVRCSLARRPGYCDRGHLQLLIDGPIQIDAMDSFPRYFFSYAEADAHCRAFLKWRLWKHSAAKGKLDREFFDITSLHRWQVKDPDMEDILQAFEGEEKSCET